MVTLNLISAGKENMSKIVKETEYRCRNKSSEEAGMELVDRLFYECNTGKFHVTSGMYFTSQYLPAHLSLVTLCLQ